MILYWSQCYYLRYDVDIFLARPLCFKVILFYGYWEKDMNIAIMFCDSWLPRVFFSSSSCFFFFFFFFFLQKDLEHTKIYFIFEWEVFFFFSTKWKGAMKFFPFAARLENWLQWAVQAEMFFKTGVFTHGQAKIKCYLSATYCELWFFPESSF